VVVGVATLPEGIDLAIINDTDAAKCKVQSAGSIFLDG
jgi:hypothetical protein